MKRTSALIVIAAMICSNCAARGPALRVDRPVTDHPGSPAPATRNRSGAPQDPDIWRQYASRLPIGSTVRIRTAGGERLTAVLLVVDADAITVKPRTRIPEPARQIPFDRLDQLELARENASLAQSAAIGAGVGAGVFLGLLMLLFANID